MGTIGKRIVEAITFLENNGYVIYPDFKSLHGKWCAFRQPGMEPILHGKIMDVTLNGICTIKCKNAEIRYKHVKKLIGIYDNKDECYGVR